ncbi:MAG TPA: glycosyltransferase [Solirubrobacteraceae bacterium]|jgi:SAM-dependent methyltransferase
MLNWLTRYAPLTAELELDASGALRESVLDVGCGPYGLSIIAPEATFAGAEVVFEAPVAPGMVAIRYDPGPLPFEDGAFDTVISLDVLEHVPPQARAGFVAELVRVCARRVFIACPSDEGVWAEEVLKQVYAAQGIALPGWLNEHDEHGLPTAAEIAGYVSAVNGTAARPLTMPNGLLSALSVLGDVVPGLAERAAVEWTHNRSQWEALFRAGAFGDSYRKGWVIERDARRPALLGAGDLRTSIWGATRCPACGHPALTAESVGVRCGNCGHAAGPDASGAVDLRAPEAAATPPVQLPAPPGDALVLRPERWSRPMDWLPALSAYVVWVPVGREVTLYLDARGADVEAGLLRSLIESVCTFLSDGQEYASIGLMEQGVEPPPGAEAVTGPLELVERLGLEVPILTEDPAEIVEHARWAKQILDAVQGDIDRAAFEAAPRPALTYDSLVTVRIPTFGSVDLLLERAIASVLAGVHQNLELLVCSDGPQPHARAAVEAIEDSRVRYLELDERPTYPSRKESFWQVAGTYPVNRLLDEARGEVIAPLDHDDGFTYGHIHVLIEELMHGGDFVFGQAMTEYPLGDWHLVGSPPLRYGEVVHASVMYSSRLRHMRYDPYAWLLDEPGDWNMWRRMQTAGAAVRHVPQPVAVHFKERSSISGQQRDAVDELADLAGDLMATPARELLTISSRERGVRLA